MLVGMSMIGDVVLTWAGRDFGALDMERQIIAGATACTLGVTSFFGGFLLSVIAGNIGDIDQAISRPSDIGINLEPVRARYGADME
jgi:hypothetical protein